MSRGMKKTVAAGFAGAAMAAALSFAAAPASAAPSQESALSNNPTIQNIDLALDRAATANPELARAFGIARSALPK